jgi:hypothetical protein
MATSFRSVREERRFTWYLVAMVLMDPVMSMHKDRTTTRSLILRRGGVFSRWRGAEGTGALSS